MTTCKRCGSQTTRRRLCRSCGLAELHGQSLIENEQTSEPEETMTIECADCGLIHEVTPTSRKTCPDCGYYGFRPMEALR